MNAQRECLIMTIDVNKRSKIPIIWKKIDVMKAIEQMKQDAISVFTELQNLDGDPVKLDKICTTMSDAIYTACKDNYSTFSHQGVTILCRFT